MGLFSCFITALRSAFTEGEDSFAELTRMYYGFNRLPARADAINEQLVFIAGGLRALERHSKTHTAR